MAAPVTPTFVPVNKLSRKNGVKCVAYGPPGSGKTPLIQTAPNPVLCLSEPGALTLQNSNIPACEAYTPEAIDGFYKWLFGSAEARKFDTVCVDSASQQAEIILKDELKKNKDGRKAYGEMARTMMGYFDQLYFMPQKHVYLVAKMATMDDGMRRPYFPGQDLNIRVPHLYDAVLYIAKASVPGIQNPTTAIHAVGNFNYMARDRSGKLGEFNEPNLAKIFNLFMS